MFDEFQQFVQSIGFDFESDHDDTQVLMTTSESFGTVFSKIFNISNDTVFQHINDPSHDTLKQVLLLKEFSNQKDWIKDVSFTEGSGFLPILYPCAVISKVFEYDIVLVCGLLNLSNVHKSTRLVKLCAEKNNGNFLIVGLDENNIFRILKNRGDQETDTSLNLNIQDCAIILLDTEFSEKDIEALRTSHFPNSNTNNLGFNDDETVENVTISEYLQTHFIPTNTGLKISDNSFSNNKRIDINSSDFRFEHEFHMSYQRTYDVDAFFGLFTGSELSDCLASGGTIVKFKDFSKNKKESASLKKLFEDCGKKQLSKFKCVKFAELDSSSTYEVYAVAAGAKSCEGVDTFDLKSHLESAHFYANRYPCILNGCVHSKSHNSTRNGRPDYHTQIKSNTFKWDYEASSFGCMLKSMIEFLESVAANIDGLEILFYVKSIGSKFKTIFTSLTDLNRILGTFLSPFKLENLLAINESKLFVDIAWNISPNDDFKNFKVQNIYSC